MKVFLKKNKTNLLVILFCFLVSFIILMLTSKNSFLYPFNDWVDANAFFTVGKSMVRGVVPYRDLFEQKGPFLYLIYGIGSLISYKTFIGIFLLEICAWTIGLYFLYKILKIYLSSRSSLLILPIFTSLICTIQAFTHGGGCEEFMLPLFMISLYYFFKHFKINKLTKKEMFLNGIIAGLILMMKYTLLGFWIAFTLVIFIDYLKEKDIKSAFKYPFILLAGMILVFGIFMIYFACVHGIKPFFNNYFLINMKSYGARKGIFEKIYLMARGAVKVLIENYRVGIFFLIGLILTFFVKEKWYLKIYTLILLAITIFFTYFGLIFYWYYALFFLFFVSLSLLMLFSLFDKKLDGCNKYFYGILFSVILIASLSNAYLNANYKEMRGINFKDMYQYKFANIINEDKDATLLNIDNLDCGLYTTTGIIPSTYYFERQNLPYKYFPENRDSLNRYIEDKETKYIVYLNRYDLDFAKDRYPKLFENYDLIEKVEQNFEHQDHEAYLFKVKGE